MASATTLVSRSQEIEDCGFKIKDRGRFYFIGTLSNYSKSLPCIVRGWRSHRPDFQSVHACVIATGWPFNSSRVHSDPLVITFKEVIWGSLPFAPIGISELIPFRFFSSLQVRAFKSQFICRCVINSSPVFFIHLQLNCCDVGILGALLALPIPPAH